MKDAAEKDAAELIKSLPAENANIPTLAQLDAQCRHDKYTDARYLVPTFIKLKKLGYHVFAAVVLAMIVGSAWIVWVYLSIVIEDAAMVSEFAKALFFTIFGVLITLAINNQNR